MRPVPGKKPSQLWRGPASFRPPPASRCRCWKYRSQTRVRGSRDSETQPACAAPCRPRAAQLQPVWRQDQLVRRRSRTFLGGINIKEVVQTLRLSQLIAVQCGCARIRAETRRNLVPAQWTASPSQQLTNRAFPNPRTSAVSFLSYFLLNPGFLYFRPRRSNSAAIITGRPTVASTNTSPNLPPSAGGTNLPQEMASEYGEPESPPQCTGSGHTLTP